MGLLQSLKPFWPLLFTFILPRALSYARALQVAIRTRPPPRPLPTKAYNTLNILFGAICIFIFSSLPTRRGISSENIFITTNSRLHIPTDVLFTRLALTRPDNLLTPADEALRSKLTTPILRQLYLRFGPSTLLECSFCLPDDDTSYLLYHLPTNIFAPHLLHIFLLGLATSASISNLETTSSFRLPSLLSATALLLLDLYFTSTYTPHLDPHLPAPQGLYWTASTLRPLCLILFDLTLSALVYLSATNRLLTLSPPGSNAAADPEATRQRNLQALANANAALHTAHTKLRATNVLRNSVVRDARLREAEDGYWGDVVVAEGRGGGGVVMDEGVWEDEEVQAAMARAYGSGSVDVGRMRREAGEFVRGVTGGLDRDDTGGRGGG